MHTNSYFQIHFKFNTQAIQMLQVYSGYILVHTLTHIFYNMHSFKPGVSTAKRRAVSAYTRAVHVSKVAPPGSPL